MSISSYFNRTGISFQEHCPGTVTYTVYGLDGEVVKVRNINLNAMTDASYLFYYKQGITHIPDGITFENLTNGESTFYATSIASLGNASFKKLKAGGRMFFGCGKLESIPDSITFDQLQNGSQMFANGTNKISYISKNMTLESLTSAFAMFYDSPLITSLPETINLKSLSDGNQMFYSCNLDEPSILRVLNTIPTYTSGTHNLHLGYRKNFLNSEEIANLLGTDVPILAGNYSYKGWTINVQN